MRRLLGLIAAAADVHVGLVTGDGTTSLNWSLPRRSWRCTAARAAASRGLRGGARRNRHGALQPHRMVQGACAERREGWARRSDLAITKLAAGSRRPYRPTPSSPAIAGNSAPAMASTTVKIWSPPMSTSASPIASTSRPSCSRPSALSTTACIASIGMRHTFIPEWNWFSPTAGSATAISTSWTRCRRRRSRATMKWPTCRSGHGASSPRRFMWRADWRHYVVFNHLNVYEDLEEWKFGFAVFF